MRGISFKVAHIRQTPTVVLVKSVLSDVIHESKLMKEERKLTSMNLALVLVHDLLLSRGIQAGDGPIKQAVLRHKTRLHGELQKIKIKRGATSNQDLVQTDQRAGGYVTVSRHEFERSNTYNSQHTPVCPSEHLSLVNR